MLLGGETVREVLSVAVGQNICIQGSMYGEWRGPCASKGTGILENEILFCNVRESIPQHRRRKETKSKWR